VPFRLRKDTRQWFKGIEKDLDLGFDMYYLCLMAGLATGRKEEASQAETTDLVNEFPGSYRSRGRIIIALFLTREIKAMGIKMSEKRMLHSAIRGLVDPLSSSHLSDAGMKELNKYAFGGFEILTEWFQERPRTIETFLPLYKQYLDIALNET
jgi:hypothetical protein